MHKFVDISKRKRAPFLVAHCDRRLRSECGRQNRNNSSSYSLLEMQWLTNGLDSCLVRPPPPPRQSLPSQTPLVVAVSVERCHLADSHRGSRWKEKRKPAQRSLWRRALLTGKVGVVIQWPSLLMPPSKFSSRAHSSWLHCAVRKVEVNVIPLG